MNHDPDNDASPADPSVGELVTRLSEQVSRLVRDELLLAQTELKASAKHAGLGAGLFGTAGVLALFGLGALITTAIAGLALVLPLWAAALIVAAVLLAAAGIAALVGRKQVRRTSLVPERTVDNIKRDVQEVQEARHHDHANRP
jgi:uncharacterized membrane protein YqjE